ncbi:DUF3920 family protein [Niallia circulans]|uniref:DUF3920 family protein n=1 Tax=Niallia circulans TaxID=1397 RepID=UPI0026EE62ED|nr:DUF3920 family protein [Niallia circulans]
MNDIYDQALNKLINRVSINTVEKEQLLTFNVFDRRRLKGRTIIKNKSNLISKNELEIILKLLHEDYHDLGMKITIYKNKLQVIMTWLNVFDSSFEFPILKGILNGKLGGNHRDGIISMYPFNHKFESKKFLTYKYQLYLLFGLLHEIRHAYQRAHKKKKYDMEYIGAGNKGYSSQWCERDANAFAQRFMNNNKKEINKILGITDIDWDCLWGRFTIYY